MRGHEVTLQVHVDDRVPVLFAQVHEDAVAQDARVVHEHVERAEGIEGTLDETLAPFPLRDVVVVRNGVATHGGDLRDDLFGRRRGVAGTVECSAEVVDDDLGALVGEQQRVLCLLYTSGYEASSSS